MFQQTAVRANGTTAQPMLAGRQVSRELFEAVQSAKRAGRRVMLVLLTQYEDALDVPPGVCVNCVGAEYIGIDVLLAGPFDAVPSIRVDENGGGGVLRPAYYKGKWWQVARQLAPCPVCAKVKAVQL